MITFGEDSVHWVNLHPPKLRLPVYNRTGLLEQLKEVRDYRITTPEKLGNNNPGIETRILLRSGQINQAATILENMPEIGEWLAGKSAEFRLNGSDGLDFSEELQFVRDTPKLNNSSQPLRPARAGRNHRESLLILSLIDSIRGNSERAIKLAREGVILSRNLFSPTTEAVALIRLGHSYSVKGYYSAAFTAYEEGQALGDRLGLWRLRAESFSGLGRLYSLKTEPSRAVLKSTPWVILPSKEPMGPA